MAGLSQQPAQQAETQQFSPETAGEKFDAAISQIFEAVRQAAFDKEWRKTLGEEFGLEEKHVAGVASSRYQHFADIAEDLERTEISEMDVEEIRLLLIRKRVSNLQAAI